jgi:hypothetical protein
MPEYRACLIGQDGHLSEKLHSTIQTISVRLQRPNDSLTLTSWNCGAWIARLHSLTAGPNRFGDQASPNPTRRLRPWS